MSEQQVMLPLYNKRVLVTRTREQAGTLSTRLRNLGAIPVEFPTIRIVPPSNWSTLDAALRRLFDSAGEATSAYNWVVFTSANGVNICIDRVRTLGYDPQTLRQVRVATIGPATAAALAHYGIIADLVPDTFVAESIVDGLLEDARQRAISLSGQRILLARAAEARRVLATRLEEAGAEIDEVAAYSTVPVASDDDQGREILRLLEEHQLDYLTFTSSSTVRNFVSWLKSSGAKRNEENAESLNITALFAQSVIACIGPITSLTARELGMHVDIEAREFTIDGLIEAILEYEENHGRTNSHYII